MKEGNRKVSKSSTGLTKWYVVFDVFQTQPSAGKGWPSKAAVPGGLLQALAPERDISRIKTTKANKKA